MFNAEDIKRLEAITDYVLRAGPSPTPPPDPRVAEDWNPFPMVRFPLAIGDSRGVPRFDSWTIEAQEPVQTHTGRLDACYRDLYEGHNALEVRWFCPGVGLARHTLIHSIRRFDKQLLHYDLPTTVGTLP